MPAPDTSPGSPVPGEIDRLLAAPRRSLAVPLLAAMLAVAAAAAFMVPLDRVVIARGKVVTQDPTLVIQPLETATVREVLARPGDRVRRGALLARLDPTFSDADLAQLEAQERSLRAQIERLEAESAGRPYVADPGRPETELEAALWRHRDAERRAALANFDERLRSTEALVQRSERDGELYRERLAVLVEVEAMRRLLQERQSGSRLSLLVATDSRIEVERGLAAAEQTVRAARHQLEALRAEREIDVQQRAAEVARDLVERRSEWQRVREDLAKASRRRDLVELRAAEDAVVLEVAELSGGSVVRSGERIMTLVPDRARLEVEAELRATDKGYVQVGDDAVIKLDGLRYLQHGSGRGVVRVISEDALPPEPGAPRGAPAAYRALLSLDTSGLRDLPGGFRVVPGMPVTVDIVVGRRTVADYLVDGVLRPLREGLREP